MAVVAKRKYTKRNFEHEVDLQIKILEQKAREDFLINFSQSEGTSANVVDTTIRVTRREEPETKVYIPAKAKSILEKWMYEHRLYCYPTKAEKQALAMETNLSVQKISNWFINSRRRMLPKMLQTEGRNPMNFTISRKKKKNAALANGVDVVCTTNFLSNYAIAEESKIIDQNSIFYGNEMDTEVQRSNINYDKIIQEMIVPYTETDDEESKTSHLTEIEQPYQMEEQVNRVTRGILYDQATQSKCLFILLNSSK